MKAPQLKIYRRAIADVQVSLRYNDGTSQNFSSVGRFKTIDRTIFNKTSSVDVVYSFLIATPHVEIYQNYRIIMSFTSYVLKADFSNLRYGKQDRGPASQVKIEYVDYVIARSILTLFEDWTKTLDKTIEEDERKHFKIEYDSVTQGIISICQLSACIICAGATFLIMPQANSAEILRYIIFGISALVVATFIGRVLNELYTEKFWFFGRYPYIIITKGDERNFTAFKQKHKQNLKSFRRTFFAFIAAVLTNIIATIVMILIGLQKI